VICDPETRRGIFEAAPRELGNGLAAAAGRTITDQQDQDSAMPQALDLTQHRLLGLPRSALGALRTALLRDGGPEAVAYLQEAGYAGGEVVFDSFRAWLRTKGKDAPDELDLDAFRDLATEYFREAGWGTLELGSLHDVVATIDSENWGESDETSELEHPGCHLTTGMFADFFGRLAEAPMAVLEVECRSMGSSRCRFLIGNAEVMQFLYEQMSAGVAYDEAAAVVAT
jgi:predicted hydrocarbon binding protein